ncbi:hypothetical protein CBL_11022 [Carabus blaptoides fortunei]
MLETDKKAIDESPQPFQSVHVSLLSYSVPPKPDINVEPENLAFTIKLSGGIPRNHSRNFRSIYADAFGHYRNPTSHISPYHHSRIVDDVANVDKDPNPDSEAATPMIACQ